MPVFLATMRFCCFHHYTIALIYGMSLKACFLSGQLKCGVVDHMKSQTIALALDMYMASIEHRICASRLKLT